MARAPGARRPRPRLPAAPLTVPATPAGMQRLMRAFETFATAHRIDGVARHDMHVALDEMISNVVKYGGRGAAGRMSLELAIKRRVLTATIADNGVAFNPLKAPVPDLTADLEDRRIGGLGIVLVRRLMNGMRYARRGDRNCLVLTKLLD